MPPTRRRSTAAAGVLSPSTTMARFLSDNGRGTDTRSDEYGRDVKKPVMSSKDLRFFDSPGAQLLPNGYPRRGISVVAALSAWLIHSNRRHNGAWMQRYEHGLPVTGLVPIPTCDATGTTVHFRPDGTVRSGGASAAIDPGRLASSWRELAVRSGTWPTEPSGRGHRRGQAYPADSADSGFITSP